MRYNEKELQALSRQPAEMAAELGMRGPKKGSVAKRRLVKLVVNFLFYFRPDEAEPLGALLLERCRVAQEEPGGFSIKHPFVLDLTSADGPGLAQLCPLGLVLVLSFFPDPARSQLREVQPANLGFVEDLSRKYHFECCSQEQCQEWMEALQRASYEYMRRSLIFYRNEIRKMTGKDPLEQFGISEEARFQLDSLPKDGRTACTGSQLDVLD
ncbi:Pleckstrin homology domain-containing family J member 1 [Apodemus speciosus]|uniref:Sesquipedalian n=1 Tax=Apodemus speciosus TaxID=105296 RepID=A0ABQ0F7V6_APOSI